MVSDLHVCNLIDDSSIILCVQFDVFLAVRQELYQIQHEVSVPDNANWDVISLM
jgi:hypothetical protein